MVVLTFYVLSIGPAAKVYEKCPATRQTIQAIYTPLDVLYRHCPPAARAIDWYTGVVWSAKKG